MKKLNKNKKFTDPALQKSAVTLAGRMDKVTKFIPVWVKFAVAIALGLGTMIGWKRIVVTVGEKIGKSHLTYAQGASAEIVAAGTILAADHFGLPVSTTHVLSSGVAGTMMYESFGIADGDAQEPAAGVGADAAGDGAFVFRSMPHIGLVEAWISV